MDGSGWGGMRLECINRLLARGLKLRGQPAWLPLMYLQLVQAELGQEPTELTLTRAQRQACEGIRLCEY